MISQNRSFLFYSLLASFFLHALGLAALDAYGILLEPASTLPKPVVELLRPTERSNALPLRGAESSDASTGLSASKLRILKTVPTVEVTETDWKKEQAQELKQFKTETEKKDFLTYYELLSLLIRRHLSFPVEAIQKDQGGTAYLVFTLDSRGNLKNLILRKGSGIPVLDVTALQAVRLSAPFPNFPSALKQRTIDFYLPVQFQKND